MTHPVHFQVEMPVGRRNRLLALLRPVLVIPHLLVVGGPALGLLGGGYRTGALGAVALLFALFRPQRVPATVVAGVLVWRRDAGGYLYALPLLGLVVLLAPVIAASTASQIAAGIRFTPGQVIGPIASFVVLGALASWVLASMLRQPGGAS